MGAQRLELGTEDEAPSDSAVVQRLLAEPVADEMQHPCLSVPEREREHAVTASEGAIETPDANGGEQHLGVGLAPELVAGLLQLGSQVAVVVDLAVVRHREAAAGGHHGLVPERGQVDDGEASRCQRHARAGVGPRASVVRPAPVQGVRHVERDRLEVGGRGPAGHVEQAGDATHCRVILP